MHNGYHWKPGTAQLVLVNNVCMVVILMCDSIVQQIVLRNMMKKKFYKPCLTGDYGESVQILRVYDMQGINIASDPMLASTTSVYLAPYTVPQTIPTCIRSQACSYLCRGWLCGTVHGAKSTLVVYLVCH